jgi:hypothetical protein
MKETPIKHAFHFASDGIHEAMYIEAMSIEEAEKLYHKQKKPLAGGIAQSTEQQAAKEKRGYNNAI